MSLSSKTELARALFRSTPPDSVTRISGTATADSADGTVTVQLEDGDVIEVGTIGSVSSGDTVTIHVQRGEAQVIASEGWGDAMQAAVDEAQAIAEATGQHFWHDSNGAHVTEITQEQWTQAQTGHNILVNSLGILLRKALNYIAAWTGSALSFYDGDGNAASNVTASFGSAGAQIGKSDESHIEMDYHSMRLIDKDGNAYLHVSDLRDQSGTAEVEETWTGDGSRTYFALSYTATANDYAVTVDGVTASPTKTTNSFTFSTPPAGGSAVVASYRTADALQAFTFGSRGNGQVGKGSLSEGNENVASGICSHAEGDNTTASGKMAHAEGWYTAASGFYSHAEGYNTTASGDYSHAEGRDSTASGNCAHAEGDDTIASGDYSHAEGGEEAGYHTIASGDYSHAEGINTTASGKASHTEGNSTAAQGFCSHAQNRGTIAQSEAQTALGRYNVADSTSALIIGNGTANNARSNALTVDWSGNVAAAGGLSLGTIDFIECGLTANTAAGTTATWTYVDVKLNSVVRSYGSGLSLATSGADRYGVVVSKDGYYRIGGYANVNAPSYVAVTVDGTIVSNIIFIQSGYNGAGLGSTVVKLTSGSVIKMRIERTGTTDPTVGGTTLTRLSVERVG